MEYIQTLIDTDSLKTSPTDIPNKRDLVKEGVDFTDQTPSFIIDVPKGGAIIRDLDVISANVAEITVTFITESGEKVGPIRGAPTALPTEEFPKEKVDEIVIKVTKTTDYRPPQDVILSVTACAEGITTTRGTVVQIVFLYEPLSSTRAIINLTSICCRRHLSNCWYSTVNN